ncbi:MAG TPA: serine protease [Polyangiaceae bacterium]|nr:serine protease [Polyangiaceae bacterium]
MIRRALLLAAAAASLGAAACGDDGGGPPPGAAGAAGAPACGAAPAAQAISRLGPLQCGPTLDFTPVNAYRGELAAANDREDAVAFINGNCSGTLVAAQSGPVVLTAGHCARLGDRVLVVFNFEDAPDGDELATDGTVIEQSDAPDYALVRLDALPAVTPTALTARPSDRLAVIQHPRGLRKVIAEGNYLQACPGGLFFYADLDTLVSSSGAGVLTREGRLFGVHTDGDCAEDGGGSNRGWTAADIARASPYLQAADVEACPDC